MHLGDIRKLDAVDWLNTETSELWQTNLIIRGGEVNLEGTSTVRSLVVADGTYRVIGTDNAVSPEGGSLLTLLGGTYEVSGTANWERVMSTDAGYALVEGTINVEEDFDLNGTMAGAGTLNAGTVTVTDTGRLDVANLAVTKVVNSGSVVISNANDFAADSTYVHMGNATLIFTTPGSWFSGTNVVFDGGAMIETDFFADGTLGANTVTIQREGYTPTISTGTPNTATFGGLTTVHVTTLTDETTVNVLEGGRLIVDALSGTADAVIDGGVIDIAMADVTTDHAGIDGILIDAESPADTDTVNSGVISNPNGVGFTGVKLSGITFTDATVNLTSGAANSLNALASVAQGLSELGNVTTVYNGTVAGSVDNTFTATDIRAFLAEQAGAGTSAVNPGLVLTQYDLVTDQGPIVYWTSDSGAPNAITGSIGFAHVRDADMVAVQGGQTASLTGNVLEADAPFDWSDANRLLLSSTPNSGGTVSVAEGGRMIFGSNGTPDVHTGWINTLATDGRAEVTNFVLGTKALSVTAGGSLTVTSTGAVIAGTVMTDETVNVAGTIENRGGLDFEEVETTAVAGGGKVFNRESGEALYRDMTIEEGGESVNAGLEEGRYLTVKSGAKHVNTGVSIWEKVSILEGGTAVIGSEAEGEAFEIAGDYSNAGTIDASNAETLGIVGKLENTGSATYRDMEIDVAGRSFNAGREEGGILTVEGSHENSGTSLWQGLRLDGGRVTVTNGAMEARTATAAAGSVIAVEKGVLALNGMTADEVKAATTKQAALGLRNTLDVTGSQLVVGTGAAGDTIGAADVYFGADSALVLDTTGLSGDKAIVGSGKVTVKNGSELVVTNASWGRHVLVTDGLNTAQTDAGAWQGDNLVNKTDKSLEVEVKDTQIILKAGAESGGGTRTDIQSLSNRYLAPEVVNGLINTDEGAALRDVNSKFADVAFIDRMLDPAYAGAAEDGTLDVGRSVRFVNSVLGFNAATGTDAYAVGRVTDRMDRIEAKAQVMHRLENGVWADLIGGVDRLDSLDLDGGKDDTGYKADGYGVIIGGDTYLTKRNRIGAAFTYVKGDLDTMGDLMPASTDTETYGAAIYGTRDWKALRVTGHIGYDVTKGESTMSFADAQKNAYTVKGDSESQTISLGLRADYAFRVKGFDIVPHAGIRLAHTMYDDYTVTINGQKAFTNAPEDTDIVQFPVGVSVMGAVKAGRWIFRPDLDFTLNAQAGDTDHAVKVKAVNFKGVDTYSHDVAGDLIGRLTLGLEAQKGKTSYGVFYSGAAGDAGKSAHALRFTMKRNF